MGVLNYKSWDVQRIPNFGLGLAPDDWDELFAKKIGPARTNAKSAPL